MFPNQNFPNMAVHRILAVVALPGRFKIPTCGLGNLSRLYLKLRDQKGLGKVTTSKLLAAKFPNVVPIRDSLVEQVLGWSDSAAWWMPMRELLLSGVHEIVSNLQLPDGAPAVTTLRKLDVVLWMEARNRGFKA